jgi:hypothetical protein
LVAFFLFPTSSRKFLPMSTPTPTNPQSSHPHAPATGDAPVATGPGLEVTLDRFWKKNSGLIIAVCVAILAAIVGKEGYDWYRRGQEAELGREFKEATTPDKLKSFAAAHPDHELAGLANLSLADDAYQSKKYVEAATSYQRAADVLKTGPFAARAQLGVAVSKLQGGQAAEGLEKLKQIANDTAQPAGVRSEAAYHVAMVAAEAGQVDEASKFADLASTVGPQSMWSQMASALRATLPAAAAKADAPAAPAPKS